MSEFDYTKENLSFEDLPEEWTLKQFKFAIAFVGEADGNACKAAKTAGYSVKSAHAIGSALLRKAAYSHIREYIKQHLEIFAQEYDTSKETLIQKLAAMVHTNISDIMEINENGRARLKPLDEIEEQALGAIKSISDKSGNTDEVAVTMHDSISAIREIAKIKKLYEEIAAINADNVHIYIPDDGRDDPAHRKKDEDGVDSTKEEE